MSSFKQIHCPDLAIKLQLEDIKISPHTKAYPLPWTTHLSCTLSSNNCTICNHQTNKMELNKHPNKVRNATILTNASSIRRQWCTPSPALSGCLVLELCRYDRPATKRKVNLSDQKYKTKQRECRVGVCREY